MWWPHSTHARSVVYHPHWLLQWIYQCSCMCIPVPSLWLSGYIDVTQTNLVIFTMVGLLLDRAHIFCIFSKPKYIYWFHAFDYYSHNTPAEVNVKCSELMHLFPQLPGVLLPCLPPDLISRNCSWLKEIALVNIKPLSRRLFEFNEYSKAWFPWLCGDNSEGLSQFQKPS